MHLHGWIEIGEDGQKRVVRTEMKPTQRAEDVKRLADGSLSVLPIVREASGPVEPWQRPGQEVDRFEADRIVRSTAPVDLPLVDAKQKALRRVRLEAAVRIETFAPTFRQSNGIRALASSDEAVRAEALAMFARIDAIRAACNAAEAAIINAATPAGTGIDPEWPEE